VSGYSDGRKLEYAAMASLEADGYWCIRAAGSKGHADIVAIKPGPVLGMAAEILVVQCKVSGIMGPAERKTLVALARDLGATAVCARWAPAGPRGGRAAEFRELTGPGPKDWRPWSADYALEVTP
jgi:Holliday junction resolvase